MADRYWVGGTGSWDSVAGTKWAATSGGVGGLPIPTSADDVFFDSASGAVSVLNSEAANCNNLNFTGFTGTFSGSGGTLNIFGSLTAAATVTWSHTGTLIFSGSSIATLRSGGKSLGPITISKGVGGEVILQDALVSISAITVNTGTFNTDIYNVTATSISSNNANTRTINLGSSTVTLSATTPLVFTTNANLTFNAGASTVVLSANIATFNPCNFDLTFYNVTFTNTTVSTRLFSYTGNYTFNRLTIAGPAAVGVTQVVFYGRNTFNDGLATSGTAGNRRVWFRSDADSISRTLTVNGAGNLIDADFRDIYVVGTAAPISGTRIGNLSGCDGIIFSTPKTVYWNLAGTQNWSANAWATTPAGTPSLDNFPLVQDTAAFTNSGAITQVILFTTGGTADYIGTIDMSARTSAMAIQISNAGTVYGDWKNGSGTTITSLSLRITFSGRKTQTITSAGKTFPLMTVDSYGGTVELADALDLGTNAITVTNGSFDTKNYNVTASGLTSTTTNFRTFNLGSSSITLSGSSPITFASNTNLNFNGGTSTINCTGSSITFAAGNCIFHNVVFSSTASTTLTINGVNTFNDFTIAAPAATGFKTYDASANQIILGTLTLSGASPIRRIIVRALSLGSTVSLTAGSLVASNCDFRDIRILGAAAGTVTTGTGDCGGNSGIVFPSPKTVYWNLGGTQNWSATGWAATSGGTPNINNFPLVQDTAVFNNAGAITAITIDNVWQIGTVDMSARTTAMTYNDSQSTNYYGNWLFGTGVTHSGTTTGITFSGRGVTTITSNGVTFNSTITIDCFSGTVQLADALNINSARALRLTSGTFNAVSYNVTTGSFVVTPTGSRIMRMGSGTWTISGTGTVWDMNSVVIYKGTADIVLSNNTTASRTFNGANLSYNKLTIGGNTSTSTLTITGNNQFTEIASTKTVAHIIALGTTIQTFGKWSVTGTAGNVVTVSGSGTLHSIYGSRVSGVNYLAMGSIGFAATSLGEFYAGPNSTGTNATIIKTTAPAPVTRYWVGGTGTWSTTTKWSDTSGGAGGFSVPTSADTVIFDAASSASAYTVTIGTGITLRCASLSISGPASGNVTMAGTSPLVVHGDLTIAATGVILSHSGGISLSGSTSNKVIITNGVALNSAITINCDNCTWSLGSAFNINNSITVTNGSLDLANYSVFATQLNSNNTNTRSINLGSSTLSLQNNVPLNFGVNEESRSNLIFNSGTSQFNLEGTNSSFFGNNQTFYNVSFNRQSADSITLNGNNTFNNLYISNVTTTGVKYFSLTGDQTVNGTMTIPAGAIAGARTFIRSSVIATSRTITCAAFSGADVDFCDIVVVGAASPISGTRLGDCKGNSGITFPVAKNVYWSTLTGNTNFYSNGWALTPGGVPSYDNFPLAQDTIIFTADFPSASNQISISGAYNLGTIDTSARTSNGFFLSNSAELFIYGNIINGTGLNFASSISTLNFRGRNSQTITSAGVAFSQPININSPGGSVTLQDAIRVTRGTTPDIAVVQGTFDANGYTVTTAGQFACTGTLPRTVAVGSATWLIGGSGWDAATATNLTVTGTGTISLTSVSTKAFAGGSSSYSGITLNQGGAGTLTITGNNTFKDITNSYGTTGFTLINLASTTQRLQQFSASGAIGRQLTLSGSSAASPANLILTGSSDTTSQYLTVNNVRMYRTGTGIWNLTNSINGGSFGAIFTVVIILTNTLSNFFLFF